MPNEWTGEDRREPPKYDKRKTAKKALRDAIVTAGMTGVAASAAALGSPEIAGALVQAASQLLPGVWGAVALVALPGTLAGGAKVLSDWASRDAIPRVKKRIGASAISRARG